MVFFKTIHLQYSSNIGDSPPTSIHCFESMNKGLTMNSSCGEQVNNPGKFVCMWVLSAVWMLSAHSVCHPWVFRRDVPRRKQTKSLYTQEHRS